MCFFLVSTRLVIYTASAFSSPIYDWKHQSDMNMNYDYALRQQFLAYMDIQWAIHTNIGTRSYPSFATDINGHMMASSKRRNPTRDKRCIALGVEITFGAQARLEACTILKMAMIEGLIQGVQVLVVHN